MEQIQCEKWEVNVIIFFDSICVGATVGVLTSYFRIHPAFCLLIGIAACIVTYLLEHTRIGFWTIGVLFSILWSIVAGNMASDMAGNDKIWFWVVFGLSLIVFMFLHAKALLEDGTYEEREKKDMEKRLKKLGKATKLSEKMAEEEAQERDKIQ